VVQWPQIDLEPAKDAGDRAMMHDDFFDSYRDYASRRGQGET
jgi:hypothetical protein